jgi:FkbM family methyltransferase
MPLPRNRLLRQGNNIRGLAAQPARRRLAAKFEACYAGGMNRFADVLYDLKALLPRRWIRGLVRVRSSSAPDGYDTAPSGARVYRSHFNPDWVAEMGLPAPKIVIDAGCFDGGDTLHFMRAFPGGRVISLEADPHRAEIVRANLSGTPAEIIECAVQDRDGEINWFPALVDGAPKASGSIYRMTDRELAAHPEIRQDAEPSRKVAARSLSSLLTERGIAHVDILHMDIQGAEYSALKGLGAFRPAVVFLEVDAAYIGAPTRDEVHRLLRSMGYSLAAKFSKDRLYVHRR